MNSSILYLFIIRNLRINCMGIKIENKISCFNRSARFTIPIFYTNSIEVKSVELLKVTANITNRL